MYNFRNKGLSPLDRIAPLSKTGTSKAWHEEKGNKIYHTSNKFKSSSRLKFM